jgi:hypothetical protein
MLQIQKEFCMITEAVGEEARQLCPVCAVSQEWSPDGRPEGGKELSTECSQG